MYELKITFNMNSAVSFLFVDNNRMDGSIYLSRSVLHDITYGSFFIDYDKIMIRFVDSRIREE